MAAAAAALSSWLAFQSNKGGESGVSSLAVSARVAQNEYGWTALHCAAYYDQTAMHNAAQNGRLEVARLLLESGADVNAKVSVASGYCLLQPAPLGLAGVPMRVGEGVVPAD